MADVIFSGCESSNSLELQLGCKKVSNFSVVQFSGFCKATIPSYSLPVASWCYMWHHTDTRTWWSGGKRLCLDHLRISSFGLSQSLKAHSIVYQSWFNSSSNHVLPWLGISPFWELVSSVSCSERILESRPRGFHPNEPVKRKPFAPCQSGMVSWMST